MLKRPGVKKNISREHSDSVGYAAYVLSMDTTIYYWFITGKAIARLTPKIKNRPPKV